MTTPLISSNDEWKLTGHNNEGGRQAAQRTPTLNQMANLGQVDELIVSAVRQSVDDTWRRRVAGHW